VEKEALIDWENSKRIIKYVVTNILVWSAYYLLKQKNIKKYYKGNIKLKNRKKNCIN